MKWKLLIMMLNFISFSVMSADHQIYYDKGNAKVILTGAVFTEAALNDVGKDICGSNKFCVLWFYSSEDKAAIGASAMKSGDMFAATKGLYAIYSRNKVNNQVICYDPKSGC